MKLEGSLWPRCPAAGLGKQWAGRQAWSASSRAASGQASWRAPHGHCGYPGVGLGHQQLWGKYQLWSLNGSNQQQQMPEKAGDVDER